MRRASVVTLLLVLFVTGCQSNEPDEIARQVSSEAMSPFCPGSTLHDCPSDAAVRLRQDIETKAEAGWDKARIMDWLEAEYGASIRATPDAGSGGWLAWALPVLALAIGATLAWGWLHRSARPTGPPGPAPTVAERARVEAELAELRERS